MSGGLTRRGALAVAAVTLSSCAGDAAPTQSRGGPGSGVALLNSVLALEHATVAAYAALSELLAHGARGVALTIADQEREHVRRLSALIEGLGGTPVLGRSPTAYATGFPRLRDARDALLFAGDLEERLVRAHLEALAALPAGASRRSAAALATSEAEHLALVHGLRGQPLAPEAFVTGT